MIPTPRFRAARPGDDASVTSVSLVLAATCASLLAFAPASLAAQQDPAREDTLVFRVDPLVVTATRGAREASDVPAPVSVLQRRELVQQIPNTVSDLFRNLPGLDVTGVGVNQVRPQIRGQTGQRILLLTDGIRMNNTRRQRDFGELPALVSVDEVQQVEVVRGPASVLYGSDAIGGVVNIITRVPQEDGFHGSASYLFGSVEEQSRISARVMGRDGAFSVQAGGMWRTADAYEAPSGSFGDITLADEVRVNNSGVDDHSVDLRLGWDFSPSADVFMKVERYHADDTGFGSVNPEIYAPDQADINILYPQQTFAKLTFGLAARELGSPLADRVSLTGYAQDNERNLLFQADIPFFPGAGLLLDNHNFTDIRTYGFRAEARKLIDQGLLLTYGVDGFRDRADGTDNNTSTVYGFGPPQVDETNAPSIPNAAFLSLGAFAQGEVDVGERLSLVGGGRFQSVSAETFGTPNLDNTPTSESNRTAVAALNAMLSVTDEVDLVASAGRAFRSPNLVELFFDGPVAEAGAYQMASDELQAETSFNVDVGARYHAGPLFVEGFYFRNKISDGIRGRQVLDESGDPVTRDGLDVYQNVNVDEIIFQGVELNGEVRFGEGFTVSASYSHLGAEDARDPENPVGESFSDKVTGGLHYQDPSDRFWAGWDIRHSGEQKDVALEANPLGEVIPAFTVQNLRAGVRLFETGSVGHELRVAVGNLTNELYAETSNASFFRPQPKRNLTLTYNVTF